MQKRGSIARDLGRAGRRDDQRNRRQPVSNISNSNIAIPLDVHLAMLADVADVRVVRDERQTPRPTLRLGKAQAPCDHRSKPVRTDHDRRANLTTFAVHQRVNSNCTIVIPAHDVRNSNSFGYVRASGARSIEKNRVECLPPNRQTAIAKATKPVTRAEVAFDDSAIRRANVDPGERRGSCLLDDLERAHLRQNSRGFRTQILGAWLGAGETCTIHDSNRDAGARERERQRRTRWSSSNNENVRIRHFEPIA
jgi:hypothetical protein